MDKSKALFYASRDRDLMEENCLRLYLHLYEVFQQFSPHFIMGIQTHADGLMGKCVTAFEPPPVVAKKF